MRLLLALLVCLPLTAQNRLWQVSLVALGGAHVADCASAVGKQELNPLLRGPDGRFSPARGVLVKAGVTLPLIYVQHRTPRHRGAWTVLNFVSAGVVAGVAVRNARLQ